MTWTRRRFVTRVAAGAAGLSLGPRVRAADAGGGSLRRVSPRGPGEAVPRRPGARRRQLWRSTGTPRDAYLSIAVAALSGSSRRTRTRAAPSSIRTSSRRSSTRRRRSRWPAPRSASARRDGRPAAGRRPRDGVRVRVARRREGRRRPRRLLHGAADARRPAARAARAGVDVVGLAPRPGTHRAREDLPATADRATINNWNLVAVAGEWMRTRAGPRRLAAVDRGVARSPDGPVHAVGHVPRPQRPDGLRPLRAPVGARPARRGLRGAAMPARWRHWSSAAPGCRSSCSRRAASCRAAAAARTTSGTKREQAVTFESWASRFARRGDTRRRRRVQAGRAASRSGRSARWIRPSGELWIVKNRMDPAARHGYESYSFHSQYNLLTAAMLAIAWTRADERVARRAVPGDDVGRLRLRAPAGVPQGVRERRRHLPRDRHRRRPALQPDGHPARAPPGCCRPRRSRTASARRRPTACRRSRRDSLALGPEWRDRAGAWHALAGHGRDDLATRRVRGRSASRHAGRAAADLSRPTARRRQRRGVSTWSCEHRARGSRAPRGRRRRRRPTVLAHARHRR